MTNFCNFHFAGATNPPKITKLVCNPRAAIISWEAAEGSSDKSYSIEYSISYRAEPNAIREWVEAHQKQSNEFSTTVSMSPWAKYRFRIRSVGDNGLSEPSESSEECSSQPDVPSKNPENVKVSKVAPLEMTLKWTPVQPVDHNGPDFHYLITWRPRDGSSLGWRMKIRNWRQDTYTIKCNAFKIFDFEVKSANVIGSSIFPTPMQFAYPGADRPSQAPTKFTILSGILLLSFFFPIFDNYLNTWKKSAHVDDDDDDHLTIFLIKNVAIFYRNFFNLLSLFKIRTTFTKTMSRLLLNGNDCRKLLSMAI